MTGLNRVNALSNDIKLQIIQDFGSIEKFYQKVFELTAEEYKYFMSKPAGYEQEIEKIKQQIYQVEDKLESYGIVDGRDITFEIVSDHGDIIVNKQITQLDENLKQLGTDFKTMRAWIKDNYGI